MFLKLCDEQQFIVVTNAQENMFRESSFYEVQISGDLELDCGHFKIDAKYLSARETFGQIQWSEYELQLLQEKAKQYFFDVYGEVEKIMTLSKAIQESVQTNSTSLMKCRAYVLQHNIFREDWGSGHLTIFDGERIRILSYNVDILPPLAPFKMYAFLGITHAIKGTKDEFSLSKNSEVEPMKDDIENELFDELLWLDHEKKKSLSMAGIVLRFEDSQTPSANSMGYYVLVTVEEKEKRVNHQFRIWSSNIFGYPSDEKFEGEMVSLSYIKFMV